MTRQELIQWAVGRGWTMDRWGHLQKQEGSDTGQPKKYRLKLSRIAVRYEVHTSAGWVRLRSGYLSNISITPDGKLKGMKY